MRPILVGAHRGAMCYAPENTLAAFEKAIECGTYRIELDVRRTRDGHIVLMHDETVDRTTDGSGRVADLTLDQIRSLRSGDERVPTFADVLEFVKGRCRLLVEIKADGIADDVVALIERADMKDACTISSFNEETLARVKERNPRIDTAFFLTTPRPFDAEEVIRRLGVGLLVVWPAAATPEQIASAKARGLHVRCGLRDDLTYEESYALFREMADMGVDEIACGRPDWIARMAKAYADS